jgi:hypothetical protein
MRWRALTIKAAMARQVFRAEPSSLSIVRIWHSKAAAQGDHLRPEIELSRGSPPKFALAISPLHIGQHGFIAVA